MTRRNQIPRSDRFGGSEVMRNLACRSAPREPARRMSHILGPVSALSLLTRLRFGRPEPSSPGRAPNVVRAGKLIHSPVSGVARCVCGGTRRHHPGPSRPSQRTAGLLGPPHTRLGSTSAARRRVHPPPGRPRARQPTVHRSPTRWAPTIWPVSSAHHPGKSRYVSSLQIPKAVCELAGHVRPDDAASPEETSAFWVHRNKERWAEAVRDERAQGVAVCDTDLLKLHYAWTFARAGLDATADAFTCLTLVRDALQRKALGIADLVARVVPSESVLRTHRSGDTTGTRRNFETHVHLAAPLKEWYEALNDVDPGRVVWKWPEEPLPGKRRERYDSELFDAWTDRLLTL